MIRRVAIAVLVAACGSSHTEPAAPKPATQPTMSPEMTKLHDLLAPQWQEAGPQRMKDGCASLADYHADADAIAKQTPPVGANADTWTTATKQLVAAVAGLDSACKTVDPATFDPAFAKVHDAFDALSAAAGTPKM